MKRVKDHRYLYRRGEQFYFRRKVCAYTGARVNEITQLRGEDVSEVNGIWTVHITPEAGSVKTGEARSVPLHPHLIELGLVEVLSGTKGPIFYDPVRHRGGKSVNPPDRQ